MTNETSPPPRPPYQRRRCRHLQWQGKSWPLLTLPPEWVDSDNEKTVNFRFYSHMGKQILDLLKRCLAGGDRRRRQRQ
ncbi:hypothetical protein QQP08_004081 [Theobroma cacao]|uniref:Uncharacterized protein n=1 Tax=Theobroma cacao TaxID=3641 RepID=A0A061FMC3_THECC|nr:Uncharacterized protein TCM_043039 [Theobroma cacao]WRX11594.1 hypothetical protein QQP08_004081 [Theobroma cacao]